MGSDTDVITLDLITPRNAMLFKEVRLRALQDTPTAFASTYARESRLSDDDWVKRAGQWTGERSCAYLALERGAGCGIAAGLADKDDAARGELASMWVAPEHRRRGVGLRLVETIFRWARASDIHELTLIVTGNNETAIKFYERLGFAMTGVTRPYRNDANLVEHEMRRTI